MKIRILTVCLIIFSLLGYLEWGEGSHQFIYQIEGEVLGKIFTDITSVLHPFVILPLIGQMLLLYTVIRPKSKSWILYTGIGGIALLYSFMLFVGFLTGNPKIIISTLPYLITAIVLIVLKFKRSKT